jgi:hypothetical protein
VSDRRCPFCGSELRAIGEHGIGPPELLESLGFGFLRWRLKCSRLSSFRIPLSELRAITHPRDARRLT